MTVTEGAAPGRCRPSDPRIEPWRAFLQAHARVTRRLDEELRAEHDLSLAEYDALLTIADAPDRRIRMRQLADRVILSKSGVTRLIDRLVLDGLVQRDACLSDARGAEAVLTPAGLDRLRARLADAPARHRRALPRGARPGGPGGDPALDAGASPSGPGSTADG